MNQYKGYSYTFKNISWQCPALGLYGYATERSLKSAINKKLKNLKK